MIVPQEQFTTWMSAALALAGRAAQLGEVPVGAVIAKLSTGEILSEAHNLVESRHDATAHAEILAIQLATKKIQNWRLTDCALCVTLEPCTMCIGAIRLARLPLIVFGAADERMGACGSLYDLSQDARWGTKPPRLIGSVMENESRALLDQFFRSLRE